MLLCGDQPVEAVQPVTGMNWSLLFDTRVRAPASPIPEPVDVSVGGQDLDWDVAPLLHHQQPASDLCSEQVMRRESPCGTQPLTSALSKSSDESPAVASPVRLVLPRVKVVLQRLVVGLPASQVLRLFEQFLKDLV